MRYVLFNWLSPEDIADWRTWTPEEQQADAERHMAWSLSSQPNATVQVQPGFVRD